MKIKEIRDLNTEGLKDKEKTLRDELFNLQMQNGTGQLENPKRIGHVKKEIARIQTVIREQQKG